MMERKATTQARQAPQPFLEPDDMMMEQNARRLGRQSPQPYPEPGNEDGTECQKTGETIPGTLPETKGPRKWWWNKMPEYYRIPGTQKSRWNKTVSWKSWEPHSAPELFGQQAPEP